jgi:putative ABC transport system ATP-binding protein
MTFPLPEADPDPSRQPVFRVRGLSKVYGSGETEIRALDGVDLDLHAGELIVLLGPSGSGKTTLLNNLGGLDVPTTGELWHRDLDLATADEGELTRFRRESVGFVFQFYNLIPSLTARENVVLITEIADDPMSAETALEMVHLAGRLDHFPAQLSGGEQQRVAIARAFSMKPAVLFADEPTGNLDSATGARVIDLLFELNEERNTTLVLVTHDEQLAARCQRKIYLDAGRIVSATTNS